MMIRLRSCTPRDGEQYSTGRTQGSMRKSFRTELAMYWGQFSDFKLQTSRSPILQAIDISWFLRGLVISSSLSHWPIWVRLQAAPGSLRLVAE